MTFLPIVDRELRVATRRRATYWSRVLVALVAMVITVWMLGSLGPLVAPDLLGARLFKALTSLAFFLCLFPGVILTADCLSQEKREGTLGLLFLTTLKGYDVVLGKLMGTSLRSFYGLLAGFPLMAMPFFIGGVTLGEFWRLMAVLLNTIFFSLTAGLLVSALARREQVAVFIAFLLVMATAYVLPAMGSFGVMASPVTAFHLGDAKLYPANSVPFLGSLFLVHTLGWTCLAIASWVLPRSWQDHAPAPQAAEPDRQRHPRSMVVRDLREGKPAEWLARRRQSTRWVWASLLLVLVVWAAGHAASGGHWWNERAIFLAAFSLYAVVAYWIAWEAGHRLNGARRHGILEQLICTPVSTQDIVNGQMISLERQFGLLLLTIAALDMGLLLIGCKDFSWNSRDMCHYSMLLTGIVLGMFINAYTLARVGLWLGLRSRTATSAALLSLLWIAVLPAAAFLGAIYFVLQVAGWGVVDLLAGLAVLWFVLTAVNASLFHAHAQHRLQTEFGRWAAWITDADRAKARPAPGDVTEDYGLLHWRP